MAVKATVSTVIPAMMLSNLSMTPPCPGNILPKSLTPSARFMREAARFFLTNSLEPDYNSTDLD